ncbi:MAG: uroporphyrinogen-III C-methyltransferase [Gammaproteobacteria bacterium]|nr:MAG: uroporphyrinogen-III C-methyltransferase [Gammaproteobacteria bacterium]
MDYLPLFHDMHGVRCLVVGGGAVAERKAELLLSAGATVHVVAKVFRFTNPDVSSRVVVEERPFRDEDVDGCALVVVATDEPELNIHVSEICRVRGILVNVVDHPHLCTVFVPAIVDRSPIVVAIGSSGVAPVLARLTRARIEAILPASLGRLAELAGRYRQRVKETIKNFSQRRRFWERVFTGEVAEKMAANRADEAEQLLTQLLKQPQPTAYGQVALVGAGPGDPELLTLKAVRLLQAADVVVYDRLVHPQVVGMARRDCEKIYVGKESSHHTLPQEEINALLVRLASAGKRVVRLKGGDPFIFGRGGEEIETLMEAGIDFQVVPGITSASGCSTYCGIPLTHRDHAHSVVFATGHLRDGTVNLNWQALAQPYQTTVIYMGMTGLKIIGEQLIAHGLPADMPVAVIHRGTMPEQKIVIGTLADIHKKVRQAGLKPPSLIIVGTVVNLHRQLSWFGAEAESSS